ncbi:cytochrome P450 [Marinactinospora endophytica]
MPMTRVPLYEHSDLAALWRRLHEDYPNGLAPIWLEPGVPAWLMLSWHMNVEVLRSPLYRRDPRYWRDLQDGTIPPSSPLQALYQPRANALSVDGEEHRRYRMALVEALKRLSETQVPLRITRIANELIDGFAGDGKVDVITQYAVWLPLLTFCSLFGLERDVGREVCDSMARLWDGGEDAASAYAQVQKILLDLARNRRRDPANDIASHLVRSGLSDNEVRDNLALVIAAGHDPTAHLIGNAVRMLLTSPEVRQQMSPAHQISETITTALWLDPPVPTVPGRYPVEDVELGGFRVRAGDCLVLGFGPVHAALLDRAGSIDQLAGNRAHLIWGAGPHACPDSGRILALTLAETGVRELMRRLPDLRLAVPPESLTWRASQSVRGLSSLPALFTPGHDHTRPGDPVWNPSSSWTPPTSTPPRSGNGSGRLARWLGFFFPGA